MLIAPAISVPQTTSGTLAPTVAQRDAVVKILRASGGHFWNVVFDDGREWHALEGARAARSGAAALESIVPQYAPLARDIRSAADDVLAIWQTSTDADDRMKYTNVALGTVNDAIDVVQYMPTAP